jgi:hypothetical protein
VAQFGRLPIILDSKAIGERVAKPALEAGFIFNFIGIGKDIMNSSKKVIYNRIARLSYLVGISCLLVGIVLSLASSPSSAAETQGQGDCGTGYVLKDENAPFEYSGSEIITSVFIKAGSQTQGDPCTLFTYPPGDQSNECYIVSGLGTSNVQVTDRADAPSSCHAVSHVEFYAGQVEPSPTPTETTPPPTDTPTPTETTPPPTDTPTPTETTPPPTDTATPIATDPIVTITPTDTQVPTATDPGVTETPPTATQPAPTNTPPATLPPPTVPAGTPTQQILIPETGIDLSLVNQNGGVSSWFFLFLGMGLLGVGMIFHGIASRKS